MLDLIADTVWRCVFQFTDKKRPVMGKLVLTRVIKDMIPRYRTMKGYMVPRKAGWDTHGLPVELEVEKKLGLDGKEQIEEYGMEPFIQQCKESVPVRSGCKTAGGDIFRNRFPAAPHLLWKPAPLQRRKPALCRKHPASAFFHKFFL